MLPSVGQFSCLGDRADISKSVSIAVNCVNRISLDSMGYVCNVPVLLRNQPRVARRLSLFVA